MQPQRCQLADWIIKQFIILLKTKKIKLRMVRGLIDPINKKKLTGLCIPKELRYGIYIYIEIDQLLAEKVKTAIHELGHVTWWNSNEASILKFENLMWRHSSKKMKLKFLEVLRKKARLGRQPK